MIVGGNGKTYINYFSSVAVARHLLDRGDTSKIRIILFIPDTILVHQFSQRYWDEVIDALKDPEFEVLDKLTREVYKDYMHEKGYIKDFISDDNLEYESVWFMGMGNYRSNGLHIRFMRSDEDITFNLFKEILRRVEHAENIYIDISTGWNNYIPLLLEAIRIYIIYDKLKSMGSTDKHFYIINAEPNMKAEAISHIYIRKYDVKAVFRWPYGEGDSGKIRLNKFVESLDGVIRISEKDEGALFSKIRRIMSNGKLVYNSIVYNTPLILYEDAFEGRHIIDFDALRDVEEVLEEFIGIMWRRMRNVSYNDGNNIQVGPRYHINWDNISRLIISLSIIEGIVKSLGLPLRDPYIEVKNMDKRFGDDDVSHTFVKILKLYENKMVGLNINKRFLQKEIIDIAARINMLRDGEEKIYKELECRPTISRDNECKLLYTRYDPKRNFFAHSGLSKNYLLIRRDKNRLYLRYLKNKMEEIKSFVKNPEG